MKRSVGAVVAEKTIDLIKKIPENMTIEEVIRELPETNDVPYTMPHGIVFKVPCREVKIQNMQMFVLNEKASSKVVVIYLHGGAYVHQPTIFHWAFMERLSRKNDICVLAPIYPKAPNHTYQESYQILTQLYEEILKNGPDRKIVFMGDSSGAGLALGLGLTFPEKNLPQPQEMILFSPWVDMTLENPETYAYEAVDPMLIHEPLIAYGKAWAGETDCRDYRLSPMFGTLENLQNITIYVGTREILYPDEVEFANRLKKAGVKHELVVGEGMNHVYPIFPIKEAKEVLEEVSHRIKRIEQEEK